MLFFRFPKRDKRRLEGESPRMRFFRFVIIALLFCAVIWGFWMNNERRMLALKKTDIVRSDATGLLDARQEKLLAEYRQRFREAYGLNLLISVRPDPFPEPFLSPVEKAGTLFLGLCPKAGQVVFELPPLAEAALGQSTVRYLRREHFVPYFTAGSWPEGLAEGLNLLTRRFDEALRQEAGQSAGDAPRP